MSQNTSLQPRKLTEEQIRAIEALLVEPTTVAAASAAMVSQATIFRWLADPVFNQAYRDARNRVLESTLTELQNASSDAVKTLRDVLQDASARAGERVSAARAILEYSLKGRAELELESRLKDLDDRLNFSISQQVAKLK